MELVVEALLTDLEPANPLTFEIERGHIGSTQVEISSYPEETPTVVAVLTWDGINSGERNTQTYEVSPQPFLGAAPNEYIVIAQLNFWYYGPGQYGGFENADGSRVTPLTPLLGKTYYASDPKVVYQQIEWAVEYGVDAFSIEWTTPRGVGCCGSMEDTLDDVFLKSPNINKVRWAIFYDFPLRLDANSWPECKHGTEHQFRSAGCVQYFRIGFRPLCQKVLWQSPVSHHRWPACDLHLGYEQLHWEFGGGDAGGPQTGGRAWL